MRPCRDKINRMKLLSALLILLSLNVSGQKPDTLFIHFQTNSFKVDKEQRTQIASFLINKNTKTKFKVYGHTDDVGRLKSNELLSHNRENEVYNLLLKNNINSALIDHQFFGELQPFVINDNKDNRKLNRRVELIKYVSANGPDNGASADSLLADSSAAGGSGSGPGIIKEAIQKNGIRIIYNTNQFPIALQESLEKGNNEFKLIDNVNLMQQNNIVSNTTGDDFLITVAMFCPPALNICILDSPVVIKVPVKNPYNCPVDKIKFFYSQIEEGKKVWKEENENFSPEIVDGMQMISVRLRNLCNCVNFDYKMEMPCFPADTVLLKFPKAESSYFEVLLTKNQSFYLPKVIDNTSVRVIINKGEPEGAFINASIKLKSQLYKIAHLKLTDLRYSKKKNTYFLTKKRIKKKDTTVN